MKTETMYSPKTRILSLVLSFLLIFYLVPISVFAEAIEDASTINVESIEEDQSKTSPEIYEVVELREANVKHFHLEDGTYVAAHYNAPVHYLDENGVYQDIDNALSESSGGVYGNANSRIKFSKKITGNESLFTLHDGNTKITFSLSGAKKGTKGVVTNNEDADGDTELQKLQNLEKLSSSIIYEDILEGVDIQYIVRSLNVKENIIVKEKKESYSFSFEMKLNNLTAELLETGDIEIYEGDILKYTIPAPVVFDSNGVYAPEGMANYTLADNGNGKYTLTIDASSEWMNDSSRVFPVTIDPVINTSQYWIDDTYIDSNNPNVSYVESATLEVSSSKTAYWKTNYINSLPNSAYIIDARVVFWVYVPNRTDTTNVEIIAREVISDWDDSLTYSTSSNMGLLGSVLDVQNITIDGYFSWSVKSLIDKWNDGEKYGIALTVSNSSNSNALMHSNETSGFKPYLNISYMDLKGTESYNTYSSHSAGIAGSGSVNLATGILTLAIPTLSTTDSLMPYTPTLVYSSALSGSSYTYGAAQTSNLFPYAGYGFKLNICETLLEKTYITNLQVRDSYFIYADADGTEHAFYGGDTLYYDEDGLQKVLVVGDGVIYITDDTNWTRTFLRRELGAPEVESAWYLSSITDDSGNTIAFTYDSDYRPTKVSLIPNGQAQIDMLELYYYDDGELRMIYNPSSRDAVVFRFSSTYNDSIATSYLRYLRQIDYAHGNESVTLDNWNAFALSESNKINITVDATATYTYNSDGTLATATDGLSGKAINYSYSNDNVVSIEEVASGLPGQNVKYYYHNGYTEVVSSGNDDIINTDDDIVTRYIFDNRGRAKSIYSYGKDGTEIYGATTGVYETQDNVKNNLKEQFVIGGSGVNYLLNGGFEHADSFSSDWNASSNVRHTGDIHFYDEGDYSVDFYPTLNNDATLYQYLHLGAGEYTLSMPVYASNCENISGYVEISSISGSGFSHVENIPLSSVQHTNGIDSVSIFSTTFTVSNHINDGDNLLVKFVFSNSSSDNNFTLQLDRIMLRKGIGASDYSLVTYGSFDATQINSSQSNTVPISSYWKKNSSSAPEIVADDSGFGDTVKLTATNNSQDNYVVQRIYEISQYDLDCFDEDYEESFVSNAYHEYIISGFAKAAKAMPSNAGIFRMRVEVGYYQGVGRSDAIKYYNFDFVPTATDWQFTSGSFNTNYIPDATDTNDYSCVKYIDVYLEFENQYDGYALFDNISVISSSTYDKTKYTYYSTGLLASMESGAYKEYYEYNDDRELITVVNNSQKIVEYTYYNNKLLSETEYDFTFIDEETYDFSTFDSKITKEAKYRTEYSYNDYGLLTSIRSYIPDDYLCFVEGGDALTTTYAYNTSEGSRIFGSLYVEWDNYNNLFRYYYDESNGQLLCVYNDETNEGTCYSYDEMGKLISVLPATHEDNYTQNYTPVTNGESVEYTYDSHNRLSKITTESTEYNFDYDSFGNQEEISVGDNSIVEYVYGSNNGKLEKIIYGNNFSIEYVYNTLELVSEIWYNNGTKTLAYQYEYTDDGLLYKFINNINGKTTVYKYDENNRLSSYAEYDNDEEIYRYYSRCAYDNKGQLIGLSFGIDNSINTLAKVSYSYTYSNDGLLTQTVANSSAGQIVSDYVYDEFYRIGEKHYSFYDRNSTSSSFTNDVYYYYDSIEVTEEEYATGYRVGRYTSKISGVTTRNDVYTYDTNGNIIKIVDSNSIAVSYTYDDLGQLISETKGLITRTYEYDNAGNITSITQTRKTLSPLPNPGFGPIIKTSSTESSVVTSTKTLEYANSQWGDLLTSFNGVTITYDAIGNPLSYYNGTSYTFTWEGRRLIGAVSGSNTMSFEYNDEGIRTSKTVNGVTTTYYLNGSQIIGEETNGAITLYIYDEAGSPQGMQYKASASADWEIFWFEKNLQGDIVTVYNSAGTKVATYTYSDAWGNHTVSYSNDGGSTAVVNNPFRYRGYYYDSDLGMYYLQSRYYDAKICRFISPDHVSIITATPTALTDKNLFAYCDNNPVMRIDETGEFWNILIGAGVGAVVGAAISIVTQLLLEDSPPIDSEEFWANVGLSAVGGMISGGLAASGVPLAGQMIGNAIIGGMTGFFDVAIKDHYSNNSSSSFGTYALSIVDGAIIGLISGRIGGRGSASKHVSNSFWRMVSSGGSNLRYYFTQINKQAARDGLKAIPSILKATIPSLIDFGMSYLSQ